MEQLRLRDILKADPVFRAWFMTIPELEVTLAKPWRLYVQQEQGGPWARGDLRTYAKAYTQVKLRLPDAWDLVIHSKVQHFPPPIVKKKNKNYWLPLPDGHHWCSLCRRPVVMRTFKKHPALKYACNPDELRCTVCGMRAISMRAFPSPLSWPATLAK